MICIQIAIFVLNLYVVCCQEGLAGQGSITSDQRDDLLKKQHDTEREIAEKIRRMQNGHITELKTRLGARRRDALEQLRDKQEREKAEVSVN